MSAETVRLLQAGTLSGREAATALSALCAEAKKLASRKEIDAAFSDRKPLYALLSSDEPKARKNAARLLGALGDGRDAAALAAALAAEETLFVIPSLLLALGSVGGKGARSALAAYAPPAPKSESEDSNCREIADALQKARNSLDKTPLPVLSRFESKKTILLVPPAGFLSELRAELHALGLAARPFPAQKPNAASGWSAPVLIADAIGPRGKRADATAAQADPASPGGADGTMQSSAGQGLTVPTPAAPSQSRAAAGNSPAAEKRPRPAAKWPDAAPAPFAPEAPWDKRTPAGLAVRTDELALPLSARTAMEILLPVAARVKAAPADIAAAFLSSENTSFSPLPGGGHAPQYPYRIELRGYAGDRAAFIEETARLIGGVNNPSRYAVELRIVADGGFVSLFERPVSVSDRRYPWRRGTVPASIHPATAACIVSAAAPFRRTDTPVVLDPFAGAGSLLFSREAAGSCLELLGVDQAAGAVAIARENARIGHSRARFVMQDALRFVPRAPVDELYANLPFGNRVGTHADNERLYRVFCRRLPELLAPTGFAALYTADANLLFRCLAAVPGLTIQKKLRTEAGGLTPWLVIVGRA